MANPSVRASMRAVLIPALLVLVPAIARAERLDPSPAPAVTSAGGHTGSAIAMDPVPHPPPEHRGCSNCYRPVPTRHRYAAYMGMGFGAGASLSPELSRIYNAGPYAARWPVGIGFGDWAIEGSMTTVDLTGRGDGHRYFTTTLGLGVKRFIHLWRGLHLQAHGALTYSWFRVPIWEPAHPYAGFAGRGLEYGAGVEYRIPVLRRWRIDLWADATRQLLQVDKAGFKPVRGRIGMWTAGYAVALRW